jgi:hypothetical protein
MNDFLPTNYEVPTKSGSYMRFTDGINRIRILGSAIVGWEGWKTQNDGSRKPIRKRMGESLSATDVDDEQIKHFWAMPVYNYQEEKIQILEITQKSIQKAIKALVADKDWGSPIHYDLVITKTGQKLDTEYQVQPKPAKPLTDGILRVYKDMEIHLEHLYEGKDPFESLGSSDDIADSAARAGL